MLNYKDLIEQLNKVKVISLLYELGAEDVVDKGDYLITNTICHNTEGGSMKLYWYENSKIFQCYTEEGPMSIFQFLQHYYETRGIEYNWYKDIYLVAAKASDFLIEDSNNRIIRDNFKIDKTRYNRRKEIELPIINKSILNVFTKYYAPEWLNDGITEATMDKFNICYSQSQNKIIIPHYDINNNLVGIRGRALNEDEIEIVGKYMPVCIEGNWYNHKLSGNLYGLNITKENIKKEKIVYLCESEKSVLQLDSFNMLNCGAAVCGSNFSKYGLNIILKNCIPNEIIICFDKEEKSNFEDKYFNKLWNICNKYKNYCDFSFIYDRDNLLDYKDSPTDKGEEIFKKLLAKRIKVR